MAVEVGPSHRSQDALLPIRRGWVLSAVMVACTAPLVAAAAGLAHKGWIPTGEFAQAELRVRDFWDHPPALGAVARLRSSTEVSSHPGPAAWWAMYPVYAAFGRTAVGLSTAVAATAGAWILATLTLAWRRGGDALTIVIGLALLALVAALGPVIFLEPWNPWFAVMPFVCMILAVWTVCAGQPWGLAVAVAAGSYCVQAHFGYAPLVAALAATSLVGLWWSERERSRDERASDAGGRHLRRLAVPLGVALGTALLMWLPPLLQQVTGDPGNLTVMLRGFGEEAGREQEMGLAGALDLVGAYLSVRGPVLLLQDARPAERSADLGTVLLVLGWLAAATVAWRRRSDSVFRAAGLLLAVAAVAAAASVVTASQIPGEVFGYLILWLGVTAALTAAAVAWTAWLVVERAAPANRPAKMMRHASAVLAGATMAVGAVLLVIEFSDPPVPAEKLSESSAELVDPVLGGLSDTGPYLVRWDDPASFGGIGTAILSELERRGVDVGVDDRLRVEMRPHRVLAETDSVGAIWVVSGAAIDRWRELAGVKELAYFDPRTAEDRDEFNRLRIDILSDLKAVGGDELASELDQNYWATRTDPRVDRELADRIDALAELGLPTAVFLSPAQLTQPARE